MTITDTRSTSVYPSFPATTSSFATFRLVNYYNGANGVFNLSTLMVSAPGNLGTLNFTANTPDLVGTIGLSVAAGGTISISATPPNGSQVTTNFLAYGQLVNTSANQMTTTINITAPSVSAGPFSFSQAGPTGSQINASLICQTGTVNPGTPYASLSPLVSVPATGGSFTVTFTGAPNYNGAAPPGGPACTLVVTGGGTPTQSQSFFFDVTSTSFTVAGHKRHVLGTPSPQPPTTPPVPGTRPTPPAGPHVRPPGQHPL